MNEYVVRLCKSQVTNWTRYSLENLIFISSQFDESRYYKFEQLKTKQLQIQFEQSDKYLVELKFSWFYNTFRRVYSQRQEKRQKKTRKSNLLYFVPWFDIFYAQCSELVLRQNYWYFLVQNLKLKIL